VEKILELKDDFIKNRKSYLFVIIMSILIILLFTWYMVTKKDNIILVGLCVVAVTIVSTVSRYGLWSAEQKETLEDFKETIMYSGTIVFGINQIPSFEKKIDTTFKVNLKDDPTLFFPMILLFIVLFLIIMIILSFLYLRRNKKQNKFTIENRLSALENNITEQKKKINSQEKELERIKNMNYCQFKRWKKK